MSLRCSWPPGSDESDVSTGTSLVRKRSGKGDKASKAVRRLTVLNWSNWVFWLMTKMMMTMRMTVDYCKALMWPVVCMECFDILAP